MIEICQYCGEKPVKYKHGVRINKKAKYCSASCRVMAHRETPKGRASYIRCYRKRNNKLMSKRRIWLYVILEVLNLAETREYIYEHKEDGPRIRGRLYSEKLQRLR